MPKAEIIDFPVSELPDRYGKARSAIYTQMDKLGIAPFKRGKRAFITDAQLRTLDALNEFLDQDTSQDIEDFIRERKPQTKAQRGTRQTGQITRQQTGLTKEPLFAELNEVFEFSHNITSLRERFELLERAANCGWLLSTSDVAIIIGISPATLVKQSEVFRWGFAFVKCPVKTGREVCWRVRSPKRK